MHAQRVRPEAVRVLGIAHADVARETLGVVAPCPDAEGAGHVLELPVAFELVGCEAGDSWGDVSKSWGRILSIEWVRWRVL